MRYKSVLILIKRGTFQLKIFLNSFFFFYIKKNERNAMISESTTKKAHLKTTKIHAHKLMNTIHISKTAISAFNSNKNLKNIM